MEKDARFRPLLRLEGRGIGSFFVCSMAEGVNSRAFGEKQEWSCGAEIQKGPEL